tara:strand:+ start:736 stop:1698 length:963 start_codon:yes stop_codon:yes gene_type:complete
MTKLNINLSSVEQASLEAYINTARKLLDVLETFNAADSEYAKPWARAIQDRQDRQSGDYSNLVGWGFRHVLSALKCMGADSVVGESWPEVSDQDLTLCYLSTMLSDGEREVLNASIPWGGEVEAVDIPTKLVELFRHYAGQPLPDDVFVDPDAEIFELGDSAEGWDGRLSSLRNRENRRIHIPHQVRVLASRFGCIEDCWKAAEREWRDSGACWNDLPSGFQSVMAKLAGESFPDGLGYYEGHEEIIVRSIRNTVRSLPALMTWSKVASYAQTHGFGHELDDRIDDLEQLSEAYHLDIQFFWDCLVDDIQFARAMAGGAQ